MIRMTASEFLTIKLQGQFLKLSEKDIRKKAPHNMNLFVFQSLGTVCR